METRLPIPKNWQDFERLCHKLWSDIWSDPNAQRNGRNGQAQAGVDVFGRPIYQGTYAGVQCKDKDSRLGSALSMGELEKECANATSFDPLIYEFTMATTAPRDASLQQHARHLSNKGFPFSVHVWSWEDIEEEIRCRPLLMQSYYPDIQLSPHDASRAHMSCASHRDQFHAFFSRPEMQSRIPPGLRDVLLPLCYEMSDNAYSHGKASRFTIVCDDRAIRLEDDGLPFNPLVGLDATKVSTESHVGSFVFAAFLREYADKVNVRYERMKADDAEVNSVRLDFLVPTSTLSGSPAEVAVDMSRASGRDGAERLAASIIIPKGEAELVLELGMFYNISAFVEFVRCMLQRIPANMRLIIYLPRLPILKRAAVWFDDIRVSFRFRQGECR